MSTVQYKCMRTDIEQDRAIKPLIYYMVLENLIVESLWSTFSSRHGGSFLGFELGNWVWTLQLSRGNRLVRTVEE
jgi:hypothetical protein